MIHQWGAPEKFQDLPEGGYGVVLPGMCKHVAAYVQACPTCKQLENFISQTTDFSNHYRFLRIWENLSMDFVEGLPSSSGVDTVLVIVDRMTKYSHFLALKHPFSATTVAQLFVKEIVRLHGFPSTIVSDRDRVFFSLF